ncbi:MAG: CPBP family intramembrane glutamic endopeptidase [Pseudomonadota bacterium]
MLDEIRKQGKSLKFSAIPFVIVVAAAVFILLDRYHGRDAVAALAWLLGKGFAGDLRALGLGPDFIIQLLLPFLLLVLIRVSPADAGLGLGKIRQGLKIMGICALLYIPFFIILWLDPESRQYYASVASKSWAGLLCPHVPAVILGMVVTEFFFRGFMLLALRRHTGDFLAILIQLIPYVCLHFGKPQLEAFGSIPVGLALGYIAVRTGSIWYGVVLHAGFALLFDITSKLFL